MFRPLIRQPYSMALWQPAADIYRTPTGWLVKYDLAGVRLDEVDVNIGGHELTLSVTRRDSIVEEGARHHSLEISYSRFERTLKFPCSLERAQIALEQQQGMLLVRINME